MASLRDTAAAWLSSGRAAVLVQVTDAVGSVPRATGTRMLVSADASAGTIGGGHLELQAIVRAREMLASPAAQRRVMHFPLGPALGQCCGGAVTLAFSRLDEPALQGWPTESARFHLQLYGAGHVGRAIARALAPLHVHVDWIDEREEEFPARFLDSEAAWPAQVHKICVDAVEGEVRHAPAGAFYLVLTHQHDLDLRITEAILRRGDFGYLGLIGSRTKKQRFIHRFEQRGIAPDRIARLTCPIGVPGIAGKEPEVIAAAVVAQLLQCAESRPRDQSCAAAFSAGRSSTLTV
jgi:xanthine dehydrogenase accessory factor